jgi:hypothetical protein
MDLGCDKISADRYVSHHNNGDGWVMVHLWKEVGEGDIYKHVNRKRQTIK